MQPDTLTTEHTSLQTLSREAFWQRHVEPWRDSQMSKMAYCKQHALTYHQMIYWSSKSDEMDANESNASGDGGFLAVSVAPLSVGVSVRQPNGITVDGIDEHSANWVGKLVRQL